MFTIIIATHDRPLLLQRTLVSLAAQTWQDFRLIIVSDSAAYLPPYAALQAFDGRFTYIIRSGPSGPAESRNMGLALAPQDGYVIFLDDDDTFLPGHLQGMAEAIAGARPELLFCDFQVLNEDRTSQPPRPLSRQQISIADVTQDSLYVRNRIPNSCLAYRADVLAGIRYDPALVLYEDWEYLLACLKGRTLRYVPLDTVVIHKSEANAPENLRRGNSGDAQVVNVMLDLYRRHPAPDMETRLRRQAFLASGGVKLGLEYF